MGMGMGMDMVDVEEKTQNKPATIITQNTTKRPDELLKNTSKIGSDNMQLHLNFLVTLEPTTLLIFSFFLRSPSSLPIHVDLFVTIPLSRLAPLSRHSPRWLPQTNGMVGKHHRSVSDSQLEEKGGKQRKRLEETSLLPRPSTTPICLPLSD